MVILSWFYYLSVNHGFELYRRYWGFAFIMFFGSFIGGATSEGGGAVAFPVFTLLLNLPAPVARNFTFAIQSISMTAASILIIGMKIPVDWKAVRLAAFSGTPGLFIGMFLIAPVIPSAVTKLVFVSLWLSFSCALFLLNRKNNRKIMRGLQNTNTAYILLICSFGFAGGIITSVFGDGINIVTFCLFTLYYSVNEKIATPTSIIIMTIHTIIGFATHVWIIRDFQEIAFNY